MFRHRLRPPRSILSLFRRKSKYNEPLDHLTLKALNEGFEKLRNSDSSSLLRKHLTVDIFSNLRSRRTNNYTLLDCIQSGLQNLDSTCGIYAPDPEAYNVYAPLFDHVLQDYHYGFKRTNKHPATNFGNPGFFKNLDPFAHYIQSTRIRCARTLEGYPFNPLLTKQQYNDIEDIVHCALANITDKEIKGHYHPLLGMRKSVQQQLIDDHVLFKRFDRFLQAANARNHWPTGRGVFYNFDKSFVVWVNEEDHIRVISMQRGGNIGEVYRRLIKGVSALQERIEFARNDRLGYLTFCPTNLGNTIRASVHIKLPKLGANRKKLKEIAAKYKLQVRGVHGEHTNSEAPIFDISNRRRLGLIEFRAVNELYEGVAKIIELEKAESNNFPDQMHAVCKNMKKEGPIPSNDADAPMVAKKDGNIPTELDTKTVKK